MQNAPEQPVPRDILGAVNNPLHNPPMPLAAADSVTLVDELVNFLADKPEGSSAEFLAYMHSVRRCSPALQPLAFPYNSVEGWRAWLEPGSVQSVLLDFFHLVYGDFRDYDLIQLLERWDRLLDIAGPDWQPGVPEQLAETLHEHFVRHQAHTCRQSICLDDVLFLYRRFGIVPSQANFADAAAQMIRAIEWVSVEFDCLFIRFRQSSSSLSNSCSFCRIHPPAFTAEFITVCSLASSRKEPHRMPMCHACSKFLRKATPEPRCPCCERKIEHARHLSL